jgi:hypothetical protein
VNCACGKPSNITARGKSQCWDCFYSPAGEAPKRPAPGGGVPFAFKGKVYENTRDDFSGDAQRAVDIHDA